MPANTGISPIPGPVMQVLPRPGFENDLVGPYPLNTGDSSAYAFNSIVSYDGTNVTLTSGNANTMGVIAEIKTANGLPIGGNQSYRPAGRGGYVWIRPWRAIQYIVIGEGGTGDKIETTDKFGTVLQSLFGGTSYDNAADNVLPIAQEQVVLDRATASATDTTAENFRILGLFDQVGNNFPQGVTTGYRLWKAYPIAAHIQEP